jgi:hypothetical protein
VRRVAPNQQARLFLKAIHGLFLIERVDSVELTQNLVAYPPAYDYGLLASISTYLNLLTFQTL